MKYIIGGYGEPDVYDSGEYDGAGGTGDSGRLGRKLGITSCLAKKEGEECILEGTIERYGFCVHEAFTPYLFCSELKAFC